MSGPTAAPAVSMARWEAQASPPPALVHGVGDEGSRGGVRTAFPSRSTKRMPHLGQPVVRAMSGFTKFATRSPARPAACGAPDCGPKTRRPPPAARSPCFRRRPSMEPMAAGGGAQRHGEEEGPVPAPSSRWPRRWKRTPAPGQRRCGAARGRRARSLRRRFFKACSPPGNPIRPRGRGAPAPMIRPVRQGGALIRELLVGAFTPEVQPYCDAERRKNVIPGESA